MITRLGAWLRRLWLTPIDQAPDEPLQPSTLDLLRGVIAAPLVERGADGKLHRVGCGKALEASVPPRPIGTFYALQENEPALDDRAFAAQYKRPRKRRVRADTANVVDIRKRA